MAGTSRIPEELLGRMMPAVRAYVESLRGRVAFPASRPGGVLCDPPQPGIREAISPRADVAPRAAHRVGDVFVLGAIGGQHDLRPQYQPRLCAAAT